VRERGLALVGEGMCFRKRVFTRLLPAPRVFSVYMQPMALWRWLYRPLPPDPEMGYRVYQGKPRSSGASCPLPFRPRGRYYSAIEAHAMADWLVVDCCHDTVGCNLPTFEGTSKRTATTTTSKTNQATTKQFYKITLF
jgi:hypothetical protein